jgi:predicted DNA-binding ribbon-helix-helix protein
MKSLVVKRSVVLSGRSTSITLENAFWRALKAIAKSHGLNISEMVSAIDSTRTHGNLSSAIRIFVLDHHRALSERRRGFSF